jgi:hypothetical protein
MQSIFDIFRRFPSGPLWIESVEDLSAAKERLAYLAASTPGEYFIYSEKTGGVIDDVNEDVLSPQRRHQAA